METLKAQIEAEKQKLEVVRSAETVNTDKENAILNKISELEFELKQKQAEQEEREQRKQETIEATTSIDILAQIFDTLLPAKEFKAILGPDSYDVLSQDFKQVIQVYVTDTVLAPVYAQHELEIAQKDDRIKHLNDQSLAVQKQLDAANDQLDQANGAIEIANSELDYERQQHEKTTEQLGTVKKQLEDAQAQIEKGNAAISENCKLRQDIVDLETKIQAVQQPKTESQPSQKLDDMLNAIKSRKELSVDDHIAKWNARNDVKIEVPEVKAPEITGSPFRGEDSENSQTDAGDAQSVAAGDEAVTVEQFRTLQAPAVSAISTGSVHREVASKTVEERVEELEKRVAALEVGKGAVA